MFRVHLWLTPTPRFDYVTHDLFFIVNANAKTPKERRYDFVCSQSRSDDALGSPPVPESEQRHVGDVHVHVYMGGRQYWVVMVGEVWKEAEEGAPHPTLGKGRVLSHRSPHINLPNWVLQTTLNTYRYRDRKQGA